MKLNQLEGILPNRRSCFDLLNLLETEYACTISFWISVSEPPGGLLGWRVYANGSGDIWDQLDPAGFTASALISEMHGGVIYPAIWATLLQLASRMQQARVDQYLTPSH